MRSAAMHEQFGLTDPFARGFQQATWAEGWFQHEDGIAAARFGFEEFAGRFAADLFVGGPEKGEAFAKRRLCQLQRLQREERLDDAGFHVEGAGAARFAGRNVEGPLSKSPCGIDRVVMTEDEQLSRRARIAWRVGDAENIATMFQRDSFHADALFSPFGGDDTAASIRGGFIQAG